jgi:hypothetical protein
MRTWLALGLVPLAVIRAEPLAVPVRVGEQDNPWASAGIPSSVLVPLARGQCLDPATLGVVGAPSQVEVVNRWPEDGSVRTALVHFAGASTGEIVLATMSPIAPAAPVRVADLAGEVVVDSGSLRVSIPKAAGGLIGGVWLDGAAMVDSAASGPEPRRVEVEEWGPVRAVVRVELPGAVVRLHAYSGAAAVLVSARRARPRVAVAVAFDWSLAGAAAVWSREFGGEARSGGGGGRSVELLGAGGARDTLLLFRR